MLTDRHTYQSSMASNTDSVHTPRVPSNRMETLVHKKDIWVHLQSATEEEDYWRKRKVEKKEDLDHESIDSEASDSDSFCPRWCVLVMSRPLTHSHTNARTQLTSTYHVSACQPQLPCRWWRKQGRSAGSSPVSPRSVAAAALAAASSSSSVSGGARKRRSKWTTSFLLGSRTTGGPT